MNELALQLVTEAIEDYNSIDRQVYGTIEVWTLCVVNYINQREEMVQSIVKRQNIKELVEYAIKEIRTILDEVRSKGGNPVQVMAIAHPMYKRVDGTPQQNEWELIELGLIQYYSMV